MRVLVTGCCGFIGYHVCKGLLESRVIEGQPQYKVLGVDCSTGLDYQRVSRYSDPTEQTLRWDRLELLKGASGEFDYLDLDLTASYPDVYHLFKNWSPEALIHLAAVPTPRGFPPEVYLTNNVIAHLNVLKAASTFVSTRQIPIVYASSCAVYGENLCASPDNYRMPLSAYGVSKVINEYFAYTHALEMGMRLTGLRLFNVYGPWDRSMSAISLFARALLEGKPITLYVPYSLGRDGSKNSNPASWFAEDPDEFIRDYVFIYDVVRAFLWCLEHPPASFGHSLRNVGTGVRTKVADLPWLLAKALGISYQKVKVEKEKGPGGEPTWIVARPDSCSWGMDIQSSQRWVPKVGLEEGIGRFAAWFKGYYRLFNTEG